jgi:citrate lyase beta subunit
MATSAILRRALLYGVLRCSFVNPVCNWLNDLSPVPGSSTKMLEKSRGLQVDCVAYDLEDSVTLGLKAKARTNLRKLLDQPRAHGIREQAVRINSVDTGLALEDLTEVVCLAGFII